VEVEARIVPRQFDEVDDPTELRVRVGDESLVPDFQDRHVEHRMPVPHQPLHGGPDGRDPVQSRGPRHDRGSELAHHAGDRDVAGIAHDVDHPAVGQQSGCEPEKIHVRKRLVDDPLRSGVHRLEVVDVPFAFVPPLR